MTTFGEISFYLETPIAYLNFARSFHMYSLKSLLKPYTFPMLLTTWGTLLTSNSEDLQDSF